jgi:hypothetical protein
MITHSTMHSHDRDEIQNMYPLQPMQVYNVLAGNSGYSREVETRCDGGLIVSSFFEHHEVERRRAQLVDWLSSCCFQLLICIVSNLQSLSLCIQF